jgi:hypothetical protein
MVKSFSIAREITGFAGRGFASGGGCIAAGKRMLKRIPAIYFEWRVAG